MSNVSNTSQATIDLGLPQGVEVFVGRLPLKTTRQDVMKLAEKNNPRDARMRPRRRYAYLCAYVIFNTIKDADDFISEWNNKHVDDSKFPLQKNIRLMLKSMHCSTRSFFSAWNSAHF